MNKNKNKRSIVITENGQIIFRYDNDKVIIGDVENDMFKALKGLELSLNIKTNKIKQLNNIDKDLKQAILLFAEKGNFNITKFKNMI